MLGAGSASSLILLRAFGTGAAIDVGSIGVERSGLSLFAAARVPGHMSVLELIPPTLVNVFVAWSTKVASLCPQAAALAGALGVGAGAIDEAAAIGDEVVAEACLSDSTALSMSGICFLHSHPALQDQLAKGP